MSETLVRHGIRCLLFDLGDTLWYRGDKDTWDTLEDASDQRALAILHQHFDAASLPQIDDRALGRALRQDFDGQIRATIRQNHLLEPDIALAFTRVFQAWGLPVPPDSLCRALFEAFRIRLPDSRPLFADTLSTLAELHKRGFLLGVVTNRLWGGTPFYEDIQAIGLLDFFKQEHIAVSGDLGIRKPNPHIFTYALNALQVSPQETAMIGDSLSADILGAQSLGISTIWRPKTWLSAWALAHASSSREQIMVQPQTVSRETFPGIDPSDTQMPEMREKSEALPPGMYATDDDYILARADTSRDYLAQFLHGEIRPDYVIGQLAELLNIFPEGALL
jgi:HAD superfamily hydrolase (TIGR01509 family)